MRAGRAPTSPLGSQVLLDLSVPRLAGTGGIDLELEALRHIGRDVLDVDVELLIPATQLIHRTVFLGEERILDARLVFPDLDVLLELFLEPSVNRVAISADCSSDIPSTFLTMVPNWSTNEFVVTG